MVIVADVKLSDRGGPVDAAVVDRAYALVGGAMFLVLENPAVDNAFGVWNYEIDEWRVQPFWSSEDAVDTAIYLNEEETE